MKRLLLAALVAAPLAFVATPAHAQNDPEAKLFIGYSYLRASIDDAAAGDAHGGEIQYTYYLDRHVGFTIAAAVNRGELPAPPNIFVVGTFDLQQTTIFAGPTFVLGRSNTVDLELALLGGAVRRRLEIAGFGAEVADEWNPGASAQLSLDLRLSDSIWLRALQPAVVFARTNGSWETDFRVAVGFVLRSGEIIS